MDRPQRIAAESFEESANGSNHNLVTIGPGVAQASEAAHPSHHGSSMTPILPILRLPIEILALIFTLTCNEARGVDILKPRETSLPFCFALIRVCRHWRNVALGTRALWTHRVVARLIRYGRRFKDDPNRGARLRRLRGICDLYRTKPVRLHLHFELDFADWEEWEIGPRRVVMWLQESLVYLTIRGFHSAHAIHRALRLPVLEELSVSSSVLQAGGAPTLPEIDAPRLSRRLNLLDSFCHPISEFALPFHQISDLGTGIPCKSGSHSATRCISTAHHVLEALSLFSNLTHLHLSQMVLYQSGYVSRSGPATNYHGTVSLPQLKSLEIHDRFEQSLRPPGNGRHEFLPHISTPILETFDLIFDSDLEYLEALLVAFLQRVPSLRRLRIGCCGMAAFSQPTLNMECIVLRLSGNAAFFAQLSRLHRDPYSPVLGRQEARGNGWKMSGWANLSTPIFSQSSL